jgi:hypothetical protein
MTRATVPATDIFICFKGAIAVIVFFDPADTWQLLHQTRRSVALHYRLCLNEQYYWSYSPHE